MIKSALLSFLVLSILSTHSQPGYWQQYVKYTMDINMDVKTNKFTGKQKLEYTNNSPDTLYKLFYHLYWNTFQPNSMMDAKSLYLGSIRLNNQPDWDQRVRDRISNLKEDEIGYQHISSLTMNGVKQKFTIHETIMEVILTKPIPPKSTVTLSMDFDAQVPKLIRRAGRDANDIRYSMAQWYPKICEYDRKGWDVTPYVEREFYGVWGDFDVTINIDKNYILGGTGYIQNPQEVGYGYEKSGTKVTRPAGDKLKWRFVAPNVHDFMWAADPEYKHYVKKTEGAPDFHVLYKTGDEETWKSIADILAEVYPYISKNFGSYPYKQYSLIQGGDLGGMEYPMGTLSGRNALGLAFHEYMHSWYYGILATNESLYPWMDEGFTEWATDRVQDYYNEGIQRKKLANNAYSIRILDSMARVIPKYHSEHYNTYYSSWRSGIEEPLTTQADEYQTRTGYYLGAYTKGCIFLSQLGYIAGDETLSKIMLEYYNQWKFKHPDVDDFLRVAEKVSGLQLDWYKDYWVNTTKHIDYGIDSLWEEGNKTMIRLKRHREMPMPIDVQVNYKDNSKEILYVPMYLMFGEKPVEDKDVPRTSFPAWKWTHSTYTVSVNKKLSTIKTIEIDPSQRMADVERKNNKLDIPF